MYNTYMVETNGPDKPQAVGQQSGDNKLFRDPHGMRNFIKRREETYAAISTGNIKYGEPWQQGKRRGDGVDATLKIIRAKAAVRGSINKLEGELAEEYNKQVAYEADRLGTIDKGVKDGHVPVTVFDKHKEEFSALVALPDKDSALKRGLLYIKENVRTAEKKDIEKSSKSVSGLPGREKNHTDDEEFELDSGETFYGKAAEFLAGLSAAETPYVSSNELAKTLWPEAPKHIAHSRLKTLVRTLKTGLADTKWKLGSKQGIYGGYKLHKKD